MLARKWVNIATASTGMQLNSWILIQIFWNYDIIKWDEYNMKIDHSQGNRLNRHRKIMSTYYNGTIETIAKTAIGEQRMRHDVLL